jgi:predicted transcriptional regulator
MTGEPFACVGFLAVVSKYALSPKTTRISDADKLRNRARRLLELATRSRCEGRPEYAALLMQVVTEILQHARDIEKRQEIEDISLSVGNSDGTPRRDIS